MEDVNKDYLTVYRQFFEGFAPTVDLYDQLPVKVASYNVAESEIDGEIIDWCLQYLNQRDCPPSLVIPLCSKVLEEIRQVYKRNLEYFGYRNDEDDFLTLRLMQAATKKLVEVCIRYTDNALLCTLPPPPPTGTLQAAPVSSCASKNARRTMEDRHVAIQDLHALFSIKDCGSASYYGVFDGHNGADAAVYSVSHLHQYLVESSYYPGNPELALRDAFRKTDERFNAKCVKENLRSGTTAVCALLRPKESMLYVAWLGDSQAVLVTQGKPYQLVKPHKPDQPEERERIEAMGGTVLFWGTWRVNGQLAVSRAIGDIDYKPYVSGDPDVRVIPLTGQEEFLILACDGLWDFMTEQSVSDTVYSHLAEHPGDIKGVSQRLVQVSKSRGSNDNISVLVVFLKEPGGISRSRVSGRGGDGMEVFPDIYLNQNGKVQPPGGPVPAAVSPQPPVSQQHYDEEDFGPETDVDSVDDVLLSPSIAAAKAMASQSPVPGLGKVWVPHQKLQQQQENWLKTLPWSYADAVRNPAKKPPTKPQPEVAVVEPKEEHRPVEDDDVRPIREDTPPPTVQDIRKADDVVEGEAESGDDSEEEWNYIRGEEKEADQKQEEDQDDMESRLNPNAAEFVPGLQLDPVLASSPVNGKEKSLDDVTVPPIKEFYSEICHRPSEIEPVCEKSDLLYAETSLNGDETEGLSTKAEFGDESTYSISVSMNTSIALLPDEENRLNETNPFCKSENKLDDVENEFIKDNFSLPNMEFKQVDEPLQESVDEDSFTMSPDLERPNSMNQVTSPHPQGFDSPYDFTSNTDAFSPVDLPERLTANQEPTSSSGFDSESNEEIDSNIQEKTIDGISFGDGVDVDEILKSKQDVDTPAKETDSLMTESLADALPQVSGESEDNLKSDFILDEDVERPVSPNKVVSPVPISSVEVNSVDSQPLEHLDLKELPKKDEDDEDSTVPLESPVNEGPGSELDEMAPHEGDIEGVVSFVLDEETTVPKVVHEESVVPEVVNEETIVPKVVHEETIVPKVVHEETIVPEVVNEETTVPKVVHEETNPTVDFIQELQFNESSVEKEESLPHSNDNTMESEIEAGFEIISHETAKEFDIEIKSESAKELSNVDEKLLMDKNEMELLSPQSDEVEDNEISHAKENTEINIISKSDIFQENHADINILEKEEHMEQECLPGKIDVNDVNNIINVAVKEEVFEKEVNDTFVSTFKETKENEEGDAFELKSNQPVIEEQLKNDSIISAVEEAMLEESKEGKADDSSLLVKVDILEDLSKGEISTSIEHIEPIENRAVDEQLNEEIIVTEENDFKRENIFESYSTIKEETVVDLKGETIITEELKETTRLSPTLNDEQKILDKDVSLIHHDHAQDISLKACGSLLVTSEVVNKEDLQGDTPQAEVKTESMDDSKAISQGLFENDKPLIIESTQEIQHDPEVTIKEIKVEALIEEIKTDKCSILENTEKELKQVEEDKIVKESDGLIDVSIPTEVNLVETAKPILDIEVPSLVAIETSKVTEDAAAGTPPSTPAPGPVADDNKEGLIAAAVAAAAAGAATVVAASTMASVPEKDVEKHDPIKKPTTAVTSPKKPATTKPTAGSTLTAKSATTKSPAKPAGSTSSPTKKPLAAATPAGTKAPSKPGTPASKPGTPVKPSTPTSKTAATKVSAAKPSMSAAKPTTGTGKTASKPSTPPQAKPKVESSKSAAAAKPSAPMAGKAKASTTATKPTSAEKPAAKKEEVLKKPAVASKAPPAATKAAPAARPTAASKPAVKAATPTEAAAKRPPSQSGLTKPAAAAATKSATAAPTAKPAAKPQSRPPSAKPSAPAPASSKPAAKAVTTTAKTATAKPTPPAAAKTAPAKPTTTSAKPKAPAAAAPANKTKPVPIKKPTPTDKSVKDATNNKLSAKSQVKKTDPKLSDKDNDKKAPLIEDPSLMQEHIVTTTNGHLDILENGIENGQDSPIEKSHPEIIEALN